jgi:parallel beta-helix repeat protein
MRGTSRKGILLILISLSSLFLMSSLLNVRNVAAASSTTPLTNHNGIAIHSDKEFTSANGVVSGSGTSADPFVIAGWDIDVSADPVPVILSSGTVIAGMFIANTTSYVMVKNVQVHSSIPGWWLNQGIVLWNTTNVLVESSRVWNGNHGVALIAASRSTIVENEFFNLIEPVAIVGGFPLASSTASGNVIAQNDIHGGRVVGIEVFDASDNLITGNSISNMSQWAAFFQGRSNRNVFSGNHITSSVVGIEAVYSSVNDTIVGNSIDAQILAVGVGFGANGTIVSENQIHSMQWGINLIEVTRSIVSGNTVQSTDTGIRLLEGTTANFITGNVVIAHIGIFVCGTKIGLNRIAPNDLNKSDLPIGFCH